MNGLVPSFELHFLNGVLQGMTAEQNAFYSKLVESIEEKTYLSVADQPAYLNYYIREKYKTFDRDNLERLYHELQHLGVPYDKVGDGIWWRPKYWGYDCLLALELYDEYLKVTKPTNIFSTNTHFANEKCNVRYYLGLPASSVDFLQMYGEQRNRITKFTKEHPEEYEKILEAVFAEEESKHGSWFEQVLAGSDRKDYQTHLFPCLHYVRRSKIQNYCFYWASESVTERICNAFREAENRLRNRLGEKFVGEQWDEETQLFYEIKNAFPDTEVIHHGKPEWLGKQHLDIWMPAFRVGIEYQGVQHFQPMRHLGGDEHLVTQKERDLRKSNLCNANGVHLIIVTEESPREEIFGKIKEAIANPLPFLEPPKIERLTAKIISSQTIQSVSDENNSEDNLADLWAKLLEAVRQVSPFLCKHLRDGHLVSLENNVLTIGFAPKFENYAVLVDNARNHKLIATKLLKLGYDNTKIRFIKSQ
jgi:hypothetical protein